MRDQEVWRTTGCRALVSVEVGRVVLRSRRGTDLLASFPEIEAGSRQLPDSTALDGELIVWESERLAFERLQSRLQRRGADLFSASMPQASAARTRIDLG